MRFIPFLLCALYSVSTIAAQIAVVSYTKLENESKVSRDITSQIKDRQAKLQEEVQGIQATVQKKVEDLEKSSSILTAKALDQKKEALQKELMKMDEDLKKKAQKLEEVKNETLAKVNDTIKQIVMNIAKEQKYDMVLSDVGIVYVEANLDITDAVLKDLDKKLPKIRINWDKK